MADKYKVLGSKTIFDSLVKARAEAYKQCVVNSVADVFVYIYKPEQGHIDWEVCGKVTVRYMPRSPYWLSWWATNEGPNRFPVAKSMSINGRLN